MPLQEILEAVILGVVQGVAEFLPISSSGHIVILSDLLHRLTGRSVDQLSSLQLNVALHLGTLLSILVVYRSDLRQLLSKPKLCAAIALATIPLVLLAVFPVEIGGLTLKDWIEQRLQTPFVVSFSLFGTAALLLTAQRLERGDRRLEELTLWRAVAIGFFQAAAVIPGISRSGSTIAGGLLSGMQRESAATFSFLIAVPAILGAVVLTAAEYRQGYGGGNSAAALLAGAATSFVVGVIALRWLLRILAQRKLHWFAAYCAAVATATLLSQLLLM